MVPHGTKPEEVELPPHLERRNGAVIISYVLDLANALIRDGVARGEDPRPKKSTTND